MYKLNIIQCSQLCANMTHIKTLHVGPIISHNPVCTVMGTNVSRSSRLNEFKQVVVRNCGGKSFHMFAPLTTKLVA